MTFNVKCSALRKNGHVMIRGSPCKIVDMSTSKTGKHGHAKVRERLCFFRGGGGGLPPPLSGSARVLIRKKEMHGSRKFCQMSPTEL